MFCYGQYTHVHCRSSQSLPNIAVPLTRKNVWNSLSNVGQCTSAVMGTLVRYSVSQLFAAYVLCTAKNFNICLNKLAIYYKIKCATLN